MRLADYVMSFVAQQGAKHVFLLTGGGAMDLNDALARCSDLTFVCNHNEQASAIAAENYAKATNNLGVALVTTGRGGTPMRSRAWPAHGLIRLHCSSFQGR
jgi:acetolactate synthase-1/2/3 large subunit